MGAPRLVVFLGGITNRWDPGMIMLEDISEVKIDLKSG